MLTTQIGSKAEAAALVRETITKIKARYGGMVPPRGYTGNDIILGKSLTPKAKAYLDWVRTEGVTDADIRSWWDLHPLERELVIEVDDVYRAAMFLTQKQKGLSSQDAVKEVNKYHINYGGPDDSTACEFGAHGPLPIELKDRINKYIGKRVTDSDQFKRDIDSAGSVTALIRRELRAGKLAF
jgi:hypothetical protein